MNSVIVALLGVYLFIVMGYLAKRIFKAQIDDKTITILNVYFLQVFLTFWGLLKHPIDTTLLSAPALYLLIVLAVLGFTLFMARRLFSDPKERSIATVAAVIGNTGNLGIPLSIALFGEDSIPYTTVVNLMNVFVVYTFGVYFYSRGSFSIQDSLKNIVKLPIIWAAFFAILLNLFSYEPSRVVDQTLMMGAYASMTMQLFLFGIYLYDVKFMEISKRLLSWTISIKFIALPLITYGVLSLFNLDPMIKGILFLELLMPLAVANVNLASLYECEPKIVTALVMITSLLFLGVIFLGVKLLAYL